MLTDTDFGQPYRKEYNEFGYCPTRAAKLADGRTIEIVKVDEDADFGYGYAIFLDGKEVCCRYFDGFGCSDRVNDVMKTVNEITSSDTWR